MASRLTQRRPTLASPTTATAETSVTCQAPHVHIPATLSTSSQLLASAIRLPPDSSISYIQFASSAAGTDQALEDLEIARREVLRLNGGQLLVQSYLPHVNITKEDSSLWVFAIEAASDNTSSRLASLNLHTLISSPVSQFSYQDLYPCSVACSRQRIPCPVCLNPSSPRFPPSPVTSSSNVPAHASAYSSSPDASNGEPSAARYVPRISLRKPYALFLDAVRDRLIDSFCKNSLVRCGRDARKLKKGFLLGPVRSKTEWSSAWEHVHQSRSLVHCTIGLSFHPSHILIQPHLRSTSFFPLHPFLPLPQGTPITLLPYSVPAFYLNTYNGPTGALIKQFETYLEGVGAGDWSGISPDPPAQVPSGTSPSHSPGSAFIIAWVGVQNKQGEDKGMVVIWPTSLCLTIASNSTTSDEGSRVIVFAYNRHMLTYIPELPIPLQLSPVPAPATVSIHFQPQPQAAAVQTPATLTSPTPSSNTEDIAPATRVDSGDKVIRPSLFRARTTISSDTLTTFRTLALSQSSIPNLGHVAIHVGNYVDSVAKERERERERIRRERDTAAAGAGHSPRSAPPTRNGSMQGNFTVFSGPASSPSDSQMQSIGPPTEFRPNVQMEISSTQLSTEHRFREDSKGAIFKHDVAIDEMAAKAIPKTETDTPSVATDVEEETVPHTDNPVGGLGAFEAVGGVWPQDNSFMLDFDMGFDVNIAVPPLPDAASNRGQADTLGAEMEGFGVFTDDDFSFFDDGPTRNDMVPLPPPHHVVSLRSGTGLTPSAGPAPLGMSSPIFGDGLHLDGGGLSSAMPGQIPPLPWIPNALTDGFGSKFATMPIISMVSPEHGMMASSPLKTPMTRSDPDTPNVQFASEVEIVDNNRRFQSLSQETGAFDAIPFSEAHRMADHKYAKGKFALPTPPDVEDRTESFSWDASTLGSWKIDYACVTDPRIGMVRKLRGVKRRASMQGLRDSKMSPTWIREHEDWTSPFSSDDAAEELGLPSEQDSDSDAEPWIDDEEEVLASRPSTPLPSYLPPGPSLLSTHFLHSKLLPLSTNLRSPGAAFTAEDMNTTAPVCAPTPVSPAAVLGTASERTKSLEAAVRILSQEIIESPMWAEAWRTGWNGRNTNWKHDLVWELDTKGAAQLLQSSPELDGLLDIRAWQDIVSTHPLPLRVTNPTELPEEVVMLQRLETPMLSVAKADALIQVLPSALRFWDKLGLGPRGGAKDATVYALFQEKDDNRVQQVASWLKRVSMVYSAKGFGSQHLGPYICAKSGLLPLKFESFRKTLSTFVDALPTQTEAFLLYLVIPPAIFTLASPLLRQVLSGIKKIHDKYDKRVYFQFVPEYLTTGLLEHPSAKFTGLESLVESVYNRLFRPVDRSMSQRFSAPGQKAREDFESPVFSLAHHFPGKTAFSFEYPLSDLGLMDRHTFLHVGYHVTPCKKWIIAACIDERGEAHDLGIWLTRDDFHESQVVGQVWEFAMGFARKANIEWRITVAKLGNMSEAELDGWMSHLTPNRLYTPMHASVLCIDIESTLTFLPSDPSMPQEFWSSSSGPGRSSSHERQGNGSFLVDATSSTFILPTLFQCPMTSLSDRDLGTEHSFIPDDDEMASSSSSLSSASSYEFCLRPLHTSTLVRVIGSSSSTFTTTTSVHFLHSIKSSKSRLTKSDVETHEDIVRNYHELAMLTGVRWKLKANPNLPFHLAALQVVETALECGDADMD